jgi:hypothetical protein
MPRTILSTGLHGKGMVPFETEHMYTVLIHSIRVGDVVNRWRKELDLDEVATFEGPHLAEILKVPFTYCWSPALVPKPSDWPSYIGQCLTKEFSSYR